MPESPQIRQIPRSKLLEVFKTEELVRQYEAILLLVGQLIPADTVAILAALDAHISDLVGAHAAAAISNTPAGTIAATTVQGAINELSGDITALTDAFTAFTATLGTMSTQDAAAVVITGGTVLLASGRLGYATGNGGTVTQATSKATGVTLNKPSGEITMNAAALAAGVAVSFTLTDNKIAAGDVLILNHVSGGTAGAYAINPQPGAGSASITVRNLTTGALSEALVLRFAVVKGATT